MTFTSRFLPPLLVALLLALPATRLGAEETPPPTPAPAPAPAEADITTAFQKIFTTIKAKLKAGQDSEAALTPEIDQIDALLARHAAEKTDAVAMVALMKARLYLEVFENTDQGTLLLKEIKVRFPQSEVTKTVDQVLAALDEQAATDRLFAIGQPFPLFAEKDLAGQPLALADYKGKIVLIDFWATWCGPCVAELPNVIAAYEKHHAKGFEIIGISLDKKRDALTAFITENKMPWPQYFDGLGWKNKLAEQYRIHSIPATYLLDGEGKIIAKGLRGEALEQKLAALLK